MRKVAVVFGGKSCENEISILTGVFVSNLIDREKYAVLPVYIHTDGEMYTSPKMTDLKVFKEKRYESFEKIFFYHGSVYALNLQKKRIKRLDKVDVMLNCCHGGLGEGGGVSAMSAWHGIPLASPDLTASGVFMDKATTKTVLRALHIPTLDYLRVNESDYRARGAFLFKRIGERLKYPVVVKPAHLGSSIGIALAKNEEEVKNALETVFALDDRAIVEEYLADKKDVNCAVYALRGEIFVSEAEEAFGAGIYSFEDKYIKRNSDGLKDESKKTVRGELRERIRAYAKTVYKRMNLQGVVRMDFLTSGDKAYLCEVNTVPGSLAYYLFCERITDARDFFSALLDDAIERATSEKKTITTGILQHARMREK